MKNRLAAITGLLLACLLWAAAAALAASPAPLELAGATSQAPEMRGRDALYAEGYASSGALASATALSWWYYDTTYYRVIMPGNSKGPYASYLSAAEQIDDYLDTAYSSARAVLGTDNIGYGIIYAWLTNDSSNPNLLGYYAGGNDIYINLAADQSPTGYGGTVAHETTHLLFDHKTRLYYREPVAENWITEALAYYVSETVYPFGDQASFSFNSATLKYYSKDGAQRSSWYDSGGRYNSLPGFDSYTALDFWQINTIGYFLANYSSKGWGAIQEMVGHLAGGQSIDSAFSKAYGYATGQTTTDSGEGVNTLYSKYLHYYLGHY